MLVASKNEGEIDGSARGCEYLKRVAYLNSTPNFKPLIECGFLESASGLLADASALQADARPETETYKPTEKETTTAVSEKSRSQPKKYRIEFDLQAGAFQGITVEDELRWQDAYPAVPIPPEIGRAAAWLKANPANRKSNCERFLVNWFSRAQDKAARVR
jgi:hypothetical protein